MPVIRVARSEISIAKAMVLLPCALAMLLLLGACRMDYGRNIEARALERNVPDLVIVNAQFRIIRDDSLLMTMDVERAETFGDAGNRNMVGVTFTQFNKDGTVAARGTAGKAVQIIQSDDVHFTDGLTVEVASEKALIKASGLDWTAEDKVLRGQTGQVVEITKANGSHIKGYGLYADLAGRTIELSGGVEGLINND